MSEGAETGSLVHLTSDGVRDHPFTYESIRIRQDLLDYCERDTSAMVRLLERLRALAADTA